jgi:hypothetical protein
MNGAAMGLAPCGCARLQFRGANASPGWRTGRSSTGEGGAFSRVGELRQLFC